MSKLHKKIYTYSFLAPAAIVYLVIFIVPTFLSFFFSLTRWTLSDWEFIGLQNFNTFLREPFLSIGFRNTFIYVKEGSVFVNGIDIGPNDQIRATDEHVLEIRATKDAQFILIDLPASEANY